MTQEILNIIGGWTSISILLLCILVFVLRLLKMDKLEHFAGAIFVLCAIPIVYLLYSISFVDRNLLYILQLSLMLAFILLELILDYIFKIDFRSNLKIVVLYVTLFFASTGGMIGVAGLAGKTYSIISIILFLIMSILAFYQRHKTGK
jgi:hypothetical protein